MIILKAYKFRLYPTEEQKQSLNQHGGNTRFIWNYFLDLNQEKYEKEKKFIFGYDLINLLPKIKQEKEFLKISFAQSLQQIGLHFDQALKDFIKKKKEFPKYKKKKQNDSFTVPQNFKIFKNYVYIPKIGNIKWIKHQSIKGKVKHITIKQDGELWYCSVNVELKIKQPKIKTENIVGIDVGIKTYATMSNEKTINNPKIFKIYEKKLKRNQRKLSKRIKGSNNKNKQRKILAKIHRKIKNIRKYFQHKETKNMITKCDGFILENLNIKGMMKNHCLSKAIQDCSWYQFKQFLKYKSFWNGKVFLEIDRFEPTSKKCNKCEWINNDLTLKDRTFKCNECGLIIDRDLNAAINIKKAGLKILWDTQELSRKITLEETRGNRTSVQCLSLNQEKEKISPNLSYIN